MYTMHDRADVAGESQVMSKGRLVKVRFRDQPPPNVTWMWIPLGNCHACKHFVDNKCDNPRIADADFLRKYIYSNTCPGFAVGADENDEDETDLLDAMKAVGLVPGKPSQEVEIIIDQPWSIPLTVRAHREQEIFIHMAAGSKHPDYVDMNDDLEGKP